MNKRIYILTSIIVLIILSLIVFNTCDNNAFFGMGETPDLKFPTISIKSHSNDSIVRGTVTMSGDVWDDIKIDSVILYRIYSDNGTQKSEKVATASVSNNKSWSLKFDSKKYPDGGNVFKLVVRDGSGKVTMQNINLYIDNYGPEIVINRPEAKSTDIYFNPFQVSIVPIDIGTIKSIEWELYIESSPTAKISGEETSNIIANKSYTFVIDPSQLPDKVTPKFSSGYCILRIRGKDGNDQYSKEWQIKRMFFDFGNDIPSISISSPDATNDANAATYGTDVTISGFSEDDDAIGKVVVRVTNIDTSVVTDHTIDYSSNPQKQQPVVLSLTGLTENSYKFKAKAIDIYGTESDWSSEYYFKVKASFPNINWTSPEIGSWQKGTINITATVSSPSGEIKKVERKLGDSGTWVTHEDDINKQTYNFSYSFNTATELPNGGEAKFYIRATDSGNDSVTSYIIFFVDNVLPSGSIETPPDGNSGLNQTVMIQGTASDQIGGGVAGIVNSVIINIPGIGDVTPDGLTSWSYNFDTTTVPDGPRTITVTIKDMAGNERQLTRVLNIDQNADIPLVTVTNLSNGNKIYGMFDISGTASDDDAVKDVWIKVDNSGSAPYNTWYKASGTTSWTYRLDTSLYTVGAHTLYYKSVDIYGKESSVGNINFEIDPDLPVIQFRSHSENDALGISTNKDVTGDVIKTNGSISSIEIRLQGTSYTQDWTTTGLTVTGLGTPNATFRYTINPVTYGEGGITVSIRARDDLDKVNTATINLVIDTVRPTGSLTLPLANSLYVGSDGDGTQGITGNLDLAGSCNDSVPSSGLSPSYILVDFQNKSTSETKSVIDGTPAKQIQGSVTNWTFSWNIESEGPSLKDGLYKAILRVFDRAGNQPSSTIEVDNIRIARYRPTFSNLKINNVPVAQNMYVVKDCTFDGAITDNNANDTQKGVSKIELYLSDDNIIDTGDGSAFASQTFSGSNTSENFTINYSFTSKKNYIIYRAIDKTGGWRDYPLLVNIDFNLPTQQFKYSARSYYPSTQSSNPGYTASFWIKLDATDDNDISGSTIKTKLGTTSGGDEIVGLNTYTIGDVMKVDLKDYTANPIYLWYSLKDRAGNERIAVINLSRDGTLPTISSTILSGGYLKDGNISGTSAGGGQTVTKVQVSELSFVNSSLTKDINDLSLYDATGTTSWTYTIPGLSTEGEYEIVAYVVTNNGTNWYEKFNFTYDTTPPSTDFHVAEIDGANNGRVYDNSYVRGADNNNISGTVRFYGTFNDNFTERYAATDITIQIDLDTGSWTDVTNKTKNPDGTFSWYYDYNSQTHANKVKNGATFKVRAIDKAGNISTEQTKTLNIKPYITTVTEVIGNLTPVIKWNSTTSSWENINDNESYTYRLSSGNITINGFNLNATGNEAIVYTKNSGGGNTWNVDIANDSTYSFNLTWNATQLTNGTLKVTVGGIDSNSKKFVIIKNYAATGFVDLAEMDMVERNGLAYVAYQKHYQGDGTWGSGSYLFRMYETAEGTFKPTTHANQASEPGTGTHMKAIYRGYNRLWFVNLIKDTDFTKNDGGFYIMSCDSENGKDAATGTQVFGSNTFWQTYPDHFWDFYDGDQIRLPYNDSCQTNDDGKNAWRVSALNGVADDHKDWSNPWGDLVANNGLVYTIWYDNFTNTMKYRRLYNAPSPTNNNFETGTFAGWTQVSGTTDVSTTAPYRGTYHARLYGTTPRIEQTITGLFPSTNYVLKGFVRTSNTAVTATLGVSVSDGSGGTSTRTQTSYALLTVSFTTGPSGTATVYCSATGTNASRYAYFDWLEVNLASGNKSPTNPLEISVKGIQHSITLNASGYPAFVCFDEANGDLRAYFASSANPTVIGDFTSYLIDSSGVVGAYPDIAINGSDIHIVYQDLTNGTLKYVYANNPASLPGATKIVLDDDAAPGYYCDLRLTPSGQPVITYIAYGYIGTGNAIRTVRFTGTVGVDSFTDSTKWERITLPCSSNISENKVRGYYVDDTIDYLFGFGKSDKPEFFREKP